MFMTAGTYCLVGWSLLPASARSEFGWGTWTLAALPAGIFTILSMLLAINFLFPEEKLDNIEVQLINAEPPLAGAGPLSREEWLCMVTLACTLLGWIAKPLHGISEPSIALAALLVFLVMGILDRNSFKNNVEWGFLVFFGVTYSLASIASHLKVDLWLMNLIYPLLSVVSFHPAVFLLFVLVLVYVIRLFILHTPTVMLVLISLTPWAQSIGIHPGVLLLTILMAAEAWFMSYQHVAYALTYGYTNGNAFSHLQGRKLMFFKLVVSVIGLLISIPYWKFLGFIH
jgi:di/tricarboxylate transporter